MIEAKFASNHVTVPFSRLITELMRGNCVKISSGFFTSCRNPIEAAKIVPEAVTCRLHLLTVIDCSAHFAYVGVGVPLDSEMSQFFKR